MLDADDTWDSVDIDRDFDFVVKRTGNSETVSVDEDCGGEIAGGSK